MGQQDMTVFDAISDELITELPNARTGIQNNALISGEDFEATCIAAIHHMLW
jgi:hypothetical protein